jgi:hypothetical protein
MFRYQAVCEGVAGVESVDAIFPVLRSHVPGQPYGICNHGFYETVYSYVVHWREGVTTLYVYQGSPCDGGDYVKLPVALGQPVDLSRYPSRHYRA